MVMVSFSPQSAQRVCRIAQSAVIKRAADSLQLAEKSSNVDQELLLAASCQLIAGYLLCAVLFALC